MIELITDRTEVDVLQKTQKGIYNYADLNRVESAVKELSNIAGLLDIRFAPEIKTDWGFPSQFSSDTWPTQTQMARYIGNVSKLCELVEIKANIPRSMDRLTWVGANQIENALRLVEARIQNIIQIFQYSGEIFAGEEIGI